MHRIFANNEKLWHSEEDILIISPMNTVFLRKSAAMLTLAFTLVNTTMMGTVWAACSPAVTTGNDSISCSGTSSNRNF